jgi:hypothetical protein
VITKRGNPDAGLFRGIKNRSALFYFNALSIYGYRGHKKIKNQNVKCKIKDVIAASRQFHNFNF